MEIISAGSVLRNSIVKKISLLSSERVDTFGVVRDCLTGPLDTSDDYPYGRNKRQEEKI